MVGFTINEILRNNRLLSNRDKDPKTAHYHDHEFHHRLRSSSETKTVIIDRSSPPTKQLLQEKEELLNKKILEYEKLKYENFNKEEEVKSEINYLDDFVEKLKLFIQQQEEEAIFVNGSKENTLAMMNVLLTLPYSQHKDEKASRI